MSGKIADAYAAYWRRMTEAQQARDAFNQVVADRVKTIGQRLAAKQMAGGHWSRRDDAKSLWDRAQGVGLKIDWEELTSSDKEINLFGGRHFNYEWDWDFNIPVEILTNDGSWDTWLHMSAPYSTFEGFCAKRDAHVEEERRRREAKDRKEWERLSERFRYEESQS